MATEAEILRTVINPMAAMYGRPYGCQTDNEVDMAKAEYLKTLRDVPLEALQQGWADIRVEWTQRVWPAPGAIYQASKPYIPKRPRQQHKETRVSRLQARQLLNTTREGELAFRLRIPASFVAFCMREGKPPSEQEVRAMGKDKLTAENVPEICSKVESASMRRWLESLGMSIVQRNEEMMVER